jgi:hypothetical protein
MFVVDDMAILAAILAASLASGASGASLYTQGGNKTTRTFKNNQGKTRKVKLDGALKNIDPVGTIGHITDAGPDYGKPVGDKGQIISSDSTPLERLGIGSYDAVKIGQGIADGLKKMLNPRGADQIFKKTAKYGNMGTLASDILKDQDAMKKYMDALLSGGKVFDPSNMSNAEIVRILGNPNNIAPIIQADGDKYKAIWDMINQKFPKYKVEPTIDEPWTKTKPADEEGGEGGGTQTGEGGEGGGTQTGGDGPEKPPPPPVPPKYPKPDKPDKPKKPDDKDPEKRQPDDDDDKPKKPKPLPGPPEVQEKEIEAMEKNRPQKRQVPQQWYPQYEFGGQNMLKLTDVEKLEELKNYSLFDLVNPLLEGDRNNLLAIQNRLKEKMRFSNTYPNPRPERPLPPIPANFNSGYEMRNVMPTPYPFTLDQPQANNYYDNFCYEYASELNKNIDGLKRDHTFEPEISKILNSKRTGYTATNPQIMAHQGAKSSLLEGLDSSSISAVDLMMLR